MCAPDVKTIENGKNQKMLDCETKGTIVNGVGNNKSTGVAPSFRRSHSLSEASTHMTVGTLLSFFFVVLGSYLPSFLAPMAAKATYQYALFDYDPSLTHFDNTIGTWGTDYFLAFVMGVHIWRFPSTKRTTKLGSSHTKTSASHIHTRRSQGMLVCYLLSVLAGGLAHQFYTTIESRSHWTFRFLWTICVGTVTLASSFMGSIATEMNHIDRGEPSDGRKGNLVLPIIPTWFWIGFGICSTLVVIFGGMSFQRPACDIFMAGVTQIPSTFYVMAMYGLGLVEYPISKSTRAIGCIGFILNAPLLPMYPLLVQYTNLDLGSVNLLLHTWLFVAWSLQGMTLRQVAIALDEHESTSDKAAASATERTKKES